MFNDQTKASQDPTFFNKAFLFYSQYPDCNLSFLLVLRLLAGNRPSWSGWSCSGVVNNPSEVGLAIAKARRLRTFVVGSSKSTPTENDCYLIETSGHLCLYQVVSDFQVARWDFTVFHSLDRVCSSYLLMRTSIALLHPQPLLLHIRDQLLELAHAN